MWDLFRQARCRLTAWARVPHHYGSDDQRVRRRAILATYAIHKEVAAGAARRMAVFICRFPKSRAHCSGVRPVIERLAQTHRSRIAVEVAPIAHYHMGGIAVDQRMATRVPGLFAAGEAAGGANGANRLSGNAIPEALVFGECAGRCAAAHAGARAPGWRRRSAAEAVERIRSLAEGRRGEASPVRMLDELRELMWTKVGPFRTAAGLTMPSAGSPRAVAAERRVLAGADSIQPLRWLSCARAYRRRRVARRPRRTESRGAHQRDFLATILPGAHSMCGMTATLLAAGSRDERAHRAVAGPTWYWRRAGALRRIRGAVRGRRDGARRADLIRTSGPVWRCASCINGNVQGMHDRDDAR